MQAYIRHPWTEDLLGCPTHSTGAAGILLACVLAGNEFVESLQKYAPAYLSPQPPREGKAWICTETR